MGNVYQLFIAMLNNQRVTIHEHYNQVWFGGILMCLIFNPRNGMMRRRFFRWVETTKTYHLCTGENSWQNPFVCHVFLLGQSHFWDAQLDTQVWPHSLIKAMALIFSLHLETYSRRVEAGTGGIAQFPKNTSPFCVKNLFREIIFRETFDR